jgi:DNA-binding PadR family transcriptional regulator
LSLRHALLGLLAEQPASGWDLSRRFDDVLGSVWPAGHPQIYGELRRLLAAGYIAVDTQGPRRRIAYRITDEGFAEVRRWMTEVPVDHTMRLEPLLRSVFLWLMTPEQVAEYLERESAFYHELAAEYRALGEAKDRGEFGDTPQTRSLRIAADAGSRLNEALGDWADWARERTTENAAHHRTR